MQNSELSKLTQAIHFAAQKHCSQYRRDEITPYINHPIEVMHTLAEVGGITESSILQAAVLHDTLEDTDTTPEELESLFGKEVLSIVLELTDDNTLPKPERKRQQVEKTPLQSSAAKQTRIADKICNTRDLIKAPPKNWSLERQITYVCWCNDVVEGTRGVNTKLETLFYKTSSDILKRLKEREASSKK